MRDFKGKTAVVTGAASGIGRGLADRFAAERETFGHHWLTGRVLS